MRIISDVEMLRKFEQISGRQLGMVRTVTDATEPLDIKKFDGLINDLTVDRFALALEHLNSAKDQDLATVRGQKTTISRSYYAMYLEILNAQNLVESNKNFAGVECRLKETFYA